MLEQVEKDTPCGISLDDVSSVAGSKHTSRYDGLVLVLKITYKNSAKWTGITDEIEYSYSLSILSGAKSKVYLTRYHDADTRIVYDAHGIKLVVLQAVSLSWIDASALLINLTTSLALLKFSTVIFDTMMAHVLPDKGAYKSHKVKVVNTRVERRFNSERIQGIVTVCHLHIYASHNVRVCASKTLLLGLTLNFVLPAPGET